MYLLMLNLNLRKNVEQQMPVLNLSTVHISHCFHKNISQQHISMAYESINCFIQPDKLRFLVSRVS